MLMPFGRKVGKGLISKTNAGIRNAENARMFRGEVHHVIEDQVEVGGVKLKGLVLFSKKREADEHQTFYRRLLDIERAAEGRKVYGNPTKYFEDIAGRFSRYFECTARDAVLHLRRRQKAIAQAENRFGKTILLSSGDILFEMGKIRAVNTGDRWMLTEIPKKARTVLEKLGINVRVGVST